MVVVVVVVVMAVVRLKHAESYQSPHLTPVPHRDSRARPINSAALASLDDCEGCLAEATDTPPVGDPLPDWQGVQSITPPSPRIPAALQTAAFLFLFRFVSHPKRRGSRYPIEHTLPHRPAMFTPSFR